MTIIKFETKLINDSIKFTAPDSLTARLGH